MSELEEEREVLTSIYESDPNFSVINDTTFQYKVVLDGDDRFYLVEIRWPDGYPNVVPTFNLDSFSNRLLTTEFKKKLKEKLTADATEMLGMSMTYTLFDSLKDFQHNGDLFQNSLLSNTNAMLPSTTATSGVSPLAAASSSVIKKEQLTKSQKRRQWDHRVVGDDGQMPRGHDWMDIIRHLSQTGGKDEI